MGIVVLDGELASRIAAGEVVERPSSVEKELIENALDAGALRISVSIEAGGIGLIEVSDDGRGMNADDARLCMERHATSKLKAFSDLEEISSYGFRGEALPSIASVSRLSIRTRDEESEEGLLLSANGNLSPEVKVVASPKGTTVSVRDLFFNVPARRKFLRSSNTESGHASEVFVDAALSRPDVAFSLSRDGRQVKSFPRVSTTRERVEQVLGENELICADAERGPLRVAAFLCKPERARRGASGLKILVNGRPIHDRSLSSTIAHAFGSSLERGRFPRGVVYLTLPGRLVDVNVHPQKMEVRFASARAVLDALHSVISRATTEFTLEEAGKPTEQSRPRASSLPRVHVLRDGPRPVSGERYGTRGRGPGAPSLALSRAEGRTTPPNISIETAHPLQRSGVARPTLPSPSSSPPVRSSWRGLRFVGQAGPGYLLCESKDGISVLDQHAADEVRLRGRLESSLQVGPLPGQSLLFPSVLELSPRLAKALPKREEALHRLGLDVRERSPHSVSVHSIPRLLSKLDSELIFSIIAENLLASKLPDAEALSATLSAFACYAALTSESSISRVDAEQLLRDLRDSDLELECRHGRPLLLSVSYAELSRKRGQG